MSEVENTPQKVESKEQIREDVLVEAINKNTKMLTRSNSYGHWFLRGVSMGIGTAIGATFIAAGVLYFVWQLLQILGLDQYLSPQILEQFNAVRNAQ